MIGTVRSDHGIQSAHSDQRVILGDFAILQHPPMPPVSAEALVGKDPFERLMKACGPGHDIAWHGYPYHSNPPQNQGRYIIQLRMIDRNINYFTTPFIYPHTDISLQNNNILFKKLCIAI